MTVSSPRHLSRTALVEGAWSCLRLDWCVRAACFVVEVCGPPWAWRGRATSPDLSSS